MRKKKELNFPDNKTFSKMKGLNRSL